MSLPKPNQRGEAFALMGLYALIIIIPLLIVALARPPTDQGFVYTVGKNLAMVGFTILAMQYLLSARLSWVERPFGLNLLFDFHKAMAVLAISLLLVHPVLLSIGANKWSLLFSPRVPWYVWLGRSALLILWVNGTLAIFRLALRIEYQTWRIIHNGLGGLLLPLGFIHSWNAGSDLGLAPMRVFWIVIFGAAVSAYCWHRFLRVRMLRRNPYRVTDVRPETDGVWTITLEPTGGKKRFDYLPGQFQFITFLRSPGLPVEEHHWTISSSPTEQGFVSATIKESGDFTATIGQTKPGDTALILAPFGRFSYQLHPEERDLVFIAAGIGITPFISMLRHMRDTGAEKRVLLLYANRTKETIAFGGELSRMEISDKPQLRVVHILSRASAGTPGETGHIDQEKIERFCGKTEMRKKAFYICAPPSLQDEALRCLRQCEVPEAQIHFERFSL